MHFYMCWTVFLLRKRYFKPCISFLPHHLTYQLFQIGWITLDNASNNDTLLFHLEKLLAERSIKFDKTLRRIRFVPSCGFLHVTNI